MAVSGKLFGRATIKVNGIMIATYEGATLDPGGIARDTQTGDNQVLGFTEKVTPAKIEADAKFGVGDKLSDYSFDSAVVEFKCDTGQDFILPNAWTTDTPKLSGDGKVKLMIEGEPAEEIS